MHQARQLVVVRSLQHANDASELRGTFAHIKTIHLLSVTFTAVPIISFWLFVLIMSLCCCRRCLNSNCADLPGDISEKNSVSFIYIGCYLPSRIVQNVKNLKIADAELWLHRVQITRNT